MLAPEGERPLPGVDGVDPAALLSPRRPGSHWLVYESRPRRLTLPAARFESYLREEGLEAVARMRAESGSAGESGRELYQRCAKSLVTVAGPPDEGWRGPVGCELELVLDRSPREAVAAGGIALRLLFRGRPLAGALVGAVARNRAVPPGARRTDEQGRVAFAVERPGDWLFRAVHMQAVTDPVAEADWRSWWASLTAHLGDR